MFFKMTSRSDNEIVEPRIAFEDIPLSALRQKSREKLSLLLNSQKVIMTEDGYYRDWRGIFLLSGLSTPQYTLISENHDKTKTLLDLWAKEVKSVTLSDLQKNLGAIDRFDVCDDTYNLFCEDAHAFLSRSQNVDLTTNGSPFEIVKADPDNDLITHQDLERSEKGLPLQSYDAFVIYDDKDVEFATELVEKCESKGYSLCVKDRDLLGGLSFESEAILNILSKRCNRLIIIVSKAFLESPMQRFIINFAQALGIEQGKRKIIPCLIEECHLPQMLRFCFRLDYYRNNKLFDFWDKLDKSLKASTERRSISERTSTNEIDIAANNLKINIPETPTQLYDQDSAYKFTKTPTPSEKSEMFSTKSSSPELVKQQIWPPPPKLRTASSMLNLNDGHVESSQLVNKRSQSSFYLNKISSDDVGLEAIKTKRKKWYKKFLPPSTKDGKVRKEKVIPELPEISENKEKRPWYKINKKKVGKKSKIAIECES